MRIVLTGSSGRIGRAIYGALAQDHDIIGIDRNVFSTTHVIGDCADPDVVKPLLDGADAVIHTAGPHAPHVGVVPDSEFERINVEGTQSLIECARAAGVRRFVYTSTTALYGHASQRGSCTWIDEETVPQPKSIYHRTNLAAERLLEEAARDALTVRVMRMSRCIPEPAPDMAAYRLHRGVDARDVANGHALALTNQSALFERYILSGATPFSNDDCEALASDAESVIRARIPQLAAEFDRRGWSLPQGLDRVYDPSKAITKLGWEPAYQWDEVLAQLDRASIEVLPPGAKIARKAE